MSQENVEVLDAFYAAFNRRDVDDLLRYVDPNIELRPGVMAPDSDARYLGHDRVKAFIVEIATGPWKSVTLEPTERIETEDGRILSVDQWRFRGSQGMEVERELPTLYTFREGLIVRIDGFTERADALEAVGLSESGG
jgi:ketosteroid isomerase-like protein